MVMTVAFELHKLPSEIMQMTESEFAHCCAYLKVRKELATTDDDDED